MDQHIWQSHGVFGIVQTLRAKGTSNYSFCRERHGSLIFYSVMAHVKLAGLEVLATTFCHPKSQANNHLPQLTISTVVQGRLKE